ncbi:MAG: hypothetical protein RL404_2512 [Pseudomonadota bacterium]
MSTTIRAQDGEHFSIVRDSLAIDGLHVAMVGRDRRRLQDYAGALARTLAMDSGLKVEAYQASRLESLVVDLMLHRFDAALAGIAGSTRSRTNGFATATMQPGCVLFVPDAQALPDGEFRQLLRITAGIRNQGLRLVALFNESRHGDCDGRIAALGHEVARWDLDDDHQAADPSVALHAIRHRDRAMPMLRRFAARGLASAGSAAAQSHPPHGGRHVPPWVTAAAIAVVLAVLPATLPPSLSPAPPESLPGSSANAGDNADPASAHVLTRSGSVELAGEPHPDYVRVQPGSMQEDGLPPAPLPMEGRGAIDGSRAIDASEHTRLDRREGELR